MITQTAEYALRVVVFLATLRGTPATIRQIAAATRVPEGYLAKILRNLGRARLVRSQRGLHGGSVLARDPRALSVYDVVDTVSPLPRIRECPLELPAHGTNLCPLHRRLDQAAALVEQALRDSTIADLLAEPTTSIPLGELGTSDAAATRAAELTFPVARPVPLTISKTNRRSPNGG
jgi:Rrf2 family transcriptional regulator, nitric oxide-sensitive transcriptional repressor